MKNILAILAFLFVLGCGQNSDYGSEQWVRKQVVTYLNHELQEPATLEQLQWSNAMALPDGFSIKLRYKYRAGFNGWREQTDIFMLLSNGTVDSVARGD